MIKSTNAGPYLDKPLVLEESQAVNAACVSEGGANEGFTDALNKEQIKAFHSGHNPEGEKIGRFQVKADKELKQVHSTWILHPTISDAYAIQSDAVQKVFKAEVLAAWNEEIKRYQEATVKARTGAGGIIVKDCKVIGISHMHESTREGKCLLHMHHVMHTHVRCIDDGKTYSGQFRPYFVNQKVLDTSMNLRVAEICERLFQVKMEIEAGTNAAKVVGIPPREKGARYEAATEFLKERDIEQTPASMAVAMLYTRPPRVKNVDYEQRREQWREEAQAQNFKTVPIEPTQERKESRLKAAADCIKKGVKVIEISWRLYRRGDVDRINVRGSEQLRKLINDTRQRSRRFAHGQAIRALLRHGPQGLNDALKMAQEVFDRSREPKVKLEKGTIIAVKMIDVAGKYQLRKLKELAIKNGWDLRMKGQRLANEITGHEKKQEQERGQSL